MFPLFISADEKRCFWCKDIQENIVDVMPTTSVPQIGEENLGKEQMVENANELKHSENHNQGKVDFWNPLCQFFLSDTKEVM
jgi:hypothetical protein